MVVLEKLGSLAAWSRGPDTHVACEEASRIWLDEGPQPHPRDLVDLRYAFRELAAYSVAQARLECAQDRRFARVAHGEHKWEAKFGFVRLVEGDEAGHLLRGEAAEASACLLFRRFGCELSGERRLPRKVWVSAQERQLRVSTGISHNFL
jgi:hypothetical protein